MYYCVKGNHHLQLCTCVFTFSIVVPLLVLQFSVLWMEVSAGEGLKINGWVHLRPRDVWVMGPGSSIGVLEPHND